MHERLFESDASNMPIFRHFIGCQEKTVAFCKFFILRNPLIFSGFRLRLMPMGGR